MEATPAVYRADIAHTKSHIARIDAGDLLGDTQEQAQERRARLVQQVVNLEQGLARAERYWTRAEIQGAGTRLP